MPLGACAGTAPDSMQNARVMGSAAAKHITAAQDQPGCAMRGHGYLHGDQGYLPALMMAERMMSLAGGVTCSVRHTVCML